MTVVVADVSSDEDEDDDDDDDLSDGDESLYLDEGQVPVIVILGRHIRGQVSGGQVSGHAL